MDIASNALARNNLYAPDHPSEAFSTASPLNNWRTKWLSSRFALEPRMALAIADNLFRQEIAR